MGTLIINSSILLLAVMRNGVPQSVGSQLLAALIVGLLLAFGLQFLLTNLGVAIGATTFSFRFLSSDRASSLDIDSLDSDSSAVELEKSGASSKQTLSISTSIGLAILFTINLVLFAACFLAVRFSQVDDLISGAIVGAVIWAAYFFVLLWFSTAAATSLFSTLLGFTATGISGLVALIRHAFKPDRQEATELDPKSLAVLQQIRESLDLGGLQKTLEAYLEALPPPELDRSQIRTELITMLQQPALQPLATHWQQYDRATIAAAMQQRINLSETTATQIVDELESALQDVTATTSKTGRSTNLESATSARAETDREIGYTDSAKVDRERSEQCTTASVIDDLADSSWTARLWNFIQAASPEQLSQQLDREFLQQKLEQWLKQEGGQLAAAIDWQAVAAQIDWQQLLHLVWQRVDLSDIDAQTIWQRIKNAATENSQTESSSNLESEPTHVIRLDVTDYLLNAEREALLPLASSTFRDILYDPEADPQILRSQLEPLTTQEFAALLQQRNDLSEEQIKTLTSELASIRQAVYQQVLDQIAQAPTPAETSELQQQVESYLRYTNLKYLTPQRIAAKLEAISVSAQAVADQEQLLLVSIDRSTLEAILQQRKGVSRKRRRQILDQIETWNSKFRSERSTPAHSVISTAQKVAQTAARKLAPPRRWILRQWAANSSGSPDSFASGVDASDAAANSPQIQDSEAALDRLFEHLSGSLRPVVELPQAIDQLKQDLLDRLSHFKFDRSIGQNWQAILEQISSDQRPLSLEQWQAVLGNWQEQLQSVGEEMVAGLQFPDQLSTATEAYLSSQLEQIKQHLSQHVESLQQQVQTQLAYWTEQAQQRLEATRRAAALAIWWLFAIAFTTVVSAAAAGALATQIS